CIPLLVMGTGGHGHWLRISRFSLLVVSKADSSEWTGNDKASERGASLRRLTLAYLQALQHLLIRGLELREITLGRDEYEINHSALRTRNGHQPVTFWNRLSILLNGGIAGEVHRLPLNSIDRDALHAAALPHPRLRLLEALHQLLRGFVQ